jgi:hypothetical protein
MLMQPAEFYCVSGCTKLQCSIFFSSLPLFLTWILCSLYCLRSRWGVHKIVNMFYQHYWHGKVVWVVVMYFAKTVLALYICLDASMRHLCPILKCKCVMQNITPHTLISLETLYSIFLVSAEVFQWHILVDITHLNCCLLLISKSLICLGYDATSYPRIT